MNYVLLSFAVVGSSCARAKNCMVYPPGPQRFACASAQHPELIQKRERCKQEAQGAGLHAYHGPGRLTSRPRHGLHAARTMRALATHDPESVAFDYRAIN